MASTEARRTTIIPAPGPLIATKDPLKKVQNNPPIADATIPAIGGNPEATASANVIGNATRATLIPAIISNRRNDVLEFFSDLFKLIKIRLNI